MSSVALIQDNGQSERLYTPKYTFSELRHTEYRIGRILRLLLQKVSVSNITDITYSK